MVPFHRKLNVVPILVLYLFSVSLFGCGGNIPQTKHGEQPVVRPFQPFRVGHAVQVCLDIPPHFSVLYSQEAAAMIADKVDASVTVNQGGLIIHVSYIMPPGMRDEALPGLSIPAIPADPKLTSPNTALQAKLEANHQLVISTRAQVKKWTNALRSLDPPYVSAAGDLNHCLEEATQLFSNTKVEDDSQRTVIIASFLDNGQPDIDGKVDLRGATVNIIFCPPGSECDNIDRDVLGHYDAAGEIRVYDPAKSEAEKPTF